MSAEPRVKRTPQTMILATRSAGKLRELLPLVAVRGWALHTLNDAGLVDSADEDALEVFDTFEAIGANIVVDAPYPDHYHYTDSDIDWLRRTAKKHNARLATTEKDFMRLNDAQREGISVLPVRAVFAVEPALDALLAPLIAQIENAREIAPAS